MGRLLLEVEDPCSKGTALDENGYPIACQEGYGIGSKSVITFAKEYDGELIYKMKKAFFGCAFWCENTRFSACQE